MNQDLDPLISYLTAEERRRYRSGFWQAAIGVAAVPVALFVLIGLMVNLQLMGFIFGVAILGAVVAITLRLISKKTRTEEELLRAAELRFGDSLFLQHGLIPGTQFPVLDARTRYLDNENREVFGIASISKSGAIELARY